jgi:probable addiction module antidote protein
MTEWKLFDAADFLDSEETMAEFLAAAAEDPNPDVLLYAIGAVARARGMAKLAADSGLGRESLYKALAPGAHPRYETIKRVLDALNVQTTFIPKRSGES